MIHTDFEKGFIRAEVISYADYDNYGSEAKVKESGKMRVEGKDYVVQDGDVMHFDLMCDWRYTFYIPLQMESESVYHTRP